MTHLRSLVAALVVAGVVLCIPMKASGSGHAREVTTVGWITECKRGAVPECTSRTVLGPAPTSVR